MEKARFVLVCLHRDGDASAYGPYESRAEATDALTEALEHNMKHHVFEEVFFTRLSATSEWTLVQRV